MSLRCMLSLQFSAPAGHHSGLHWYCLTGVVPRAEGPNRPAPAGLPAGGPAGWALPVQPVEVRRAVGKLDGLLGQRLKWQLAASVCAVLT